MEPQASAAFRLVAADELGLLKVVEVPAGPKWGDAAVVANWGTVDRKNGVTALCSTSSSFEPGTPSLLAAGRLGGSVQVLDGGAGTQVASWQAAGEQRNVGSLGTARVVGVHFLGSLPTGNGLSAADAAAAAHLRALSVTAGGRVSLHTAVAGAQAPWEESSSFQAAPSVACSALSGDSAALAVGGEGCQLSLWDLATQSRAWQAKGAKPSSIGLVDLAHVTAATFLDGGGGYLGRSGGGGGAGGGEDASCSVGRRVVVAGNTSHKLLLYDTAAGRRPQMEVAWRDARVTALAVDDAGQRVWAANGAGAVEALDLRTGRMGGALKGAAGSVRALAIHPGGEPLIASAGLDRFVRVHNATSRANLGRAYTKQQLTTVAWLPPLAAAAAPEAVDRSGQEPQPRRQAGKKQRREADSEEAEESEEPEELDVGSADGSDDSDNDSEDSSDSGDEGGGAQQQKQRGSGSGGSGGGRGRGGGGGGRRGGGRSGRGRHTGVKRRK